MAKVVSGSLPRMACTQRYLPVPPWRSSLFPHILVAQKENNCEWENSRQWSGSSTLLSKLLYTSADRSLNHLGSCNLEASEMGSLLPGELCIF